jgi:hypothetical protein
MIPYMYLKNGWTNIKAGTMQDMKFFGTSV